MRSRSRSPSSLVWPSSDSSLAGGDSDVQAGLDESVRKDSDPEPDEPNSKPLEKMFYDHLVAGLCGRIGREFPRPATPTALPRHYGHLLDRCRTPDISGAQTPTGGRCSGKCFSTITGFSMYTGYGFSTCTTNGSGTCTIFVCSLRSVTRVFSCSPLELLLDVCFTFLLRRVSLTRSLAGLAPCGGSWFECTTSVPLSRSGSGRLGMCRGNAMSLRGLGLSDSPALITITVDNATRTSCN
uniref:Uncharacterized protein n=1 Tax=Anopheles coluzzii TaxID=1518534 RepID=A0A8W7PUQ3_ANOCL